MMPPIVTVEQGTLFGSVSKNIDNEIFYKFQGIPYAKPPTGELRFKDTVPAEKWNGIYDATKERSQGYAIKFLGTEVVGSEDCLYLNIATKFTKGPSPVIVVVHGGALMYGSGSMDEMYGPEFFMAEDVVIVSLNYRMGIFGGLSFKDPTLKAPGNAFMKDVLMALQWIKRNIKNFGGDTDNITLFGCCTGGTICHSMLFSEKSKNLFHKLILSGGCILMSAVWATGGLKEVAKYLKMEDKSEKEIHDYLMGLSVEELYKIQRNTYTGVNSYRHEQPLYGSLIESYKNENTFLSTDPFDKLQTGDYTQLPILMGYCNKEGANIFFPQEEYNLEYGIPWYVNKNKKMMFEKFNDMYNSPKGKYLKQDLYGDSLTVFPMNNLILNTLSYSTQPIYFYKFNIDTKLNFMKKAYNCKLPGAVHYEDLGYLFKTDKTPPITPGSQEDLYVRRMVRMWANFAKYGDPTPKLDDLLKINWLPLTKSRFRFLSIEKELQMSEDDSDLMRAIFLCDLFRGNVLPRWNKIMRGKL